MTVRAALTGLNTKATGYGGLALVVASYVIPAIAPDLDRAIAAHHVRPILAHALIGTIGAIAALLGKWRDFNVGADALHASTADAAAESQTPALPERTIPT